MLKLNKRNSTPIYTLIQCLYWTTYGLIFNFASVYLLDRQFTNSQIGLILGISYALSACLQPLIATVFSKKNIRLNRGAMLIYSLVVLLALAILIFPMGKAALTLCFALILTLQSSLQPTINSLAHGLELSGIPVNFSLARGAGSLAFSLMCMLMGAVLKKMAPGYLPCWYLATILMLMVALHCFPVPGRMEAARDGHERDEAAPLLRRHPKFALFLVGLVGLAFNHIFIDNFMIQIMNSLGGDSMHLGIAISVAAVVELPAMLFYARLKRRIDPCLMLMLSGWFWFVKNALISIAPTPQAIYAAEALQFFSYAIYVPATIDYISKTLPESDFLKAQAFAGSAFTLGSVFAAFIGGRLLDMMSVRTTLMVVLAFSGIGAALFTIAIPTRRKPA